MMTDREFLISLTGVDRDGMSKAMVNISCIMLYEGKDWEVKEDITLIEPVVNAIRMLNDTIFDLTFAKESHEFMQLIGMLERFLIPENSADEKYKSAPCIVVALCPKESDFTRHVTMIGAYPTYFAKRNANYIDSIRFCAGNDCILFPQISPKLLYLDDAQEAEKAEKTDETEEV